MTGRLLASTSDGQSYVERPPVASLAGFVLSTWVQQIPADAPPYVQRNTPTGGVELTCAIGEMPRVVGPLTGPLPETLRPGTTLVGLRFHPGVGAPVLGLPAAELVDLVVDAVDIWGDDGAAVAEGVQEAAHPDGALSAVQRWIAARITEVPDPLVVEVVRRLRWGSDGVQAMTSSLYLSERQLRRRCLAAVGVAPKALHRILRFQRFVALSQRSIALGDTSIERRVARLAAEAGYADQPHLTRECVRLAGRSPAEFLMDAQRTCACGHDHSASFEPLLRARPASGGTQVR